MSSSFDTEFSAAFSAAQESVNKIIQELYDKGHIILEAPSMQFRLLWESEMDYLTHGLEDHGYKIWFTCEVDGAEYRLAAPKE